MGRKKSKKSDFQKTKLKVGRRISKGQNVTDTSFKSKKIQLRDQLKQFSVDPTTGSHQLSIEELIKKLDSQKPKPFILSKIKELVDSDIDIISTNIYEILSKTCKLILQRDSVVRKEALFIINKICTNVSEEKVSSAFPVFQSYIPCASTHLDHSIRYDSLKLLDTILMFYPRSICQSSRILNSFLDLISASSDCTSKGTAAKQLISAPMEKMTAQEWRVYVLQYLVKFLECNIYILQPEEDAEEPFMFNSKKNAIVIRKYAVLKPDALCCNIEPYEMAEDNFLVHIDVLRIFLINLMPLLFDIWREAVPVLNLTFGVFLTSESAEVMMVVLSLLHTIMEFMHLLSDAYLPLDFINPFRKKFCRQFQSIILPKFPFSLPGVHKRSQEHWTMGNTGGISDFTLNIFTCKVFALMVSDTDTYTKSGHKKILDFMLVQITEIKTDDDKKLSHLLDVLKLFCRDKDSYNEYEELLESLFNLYCRYHDNILHKIIRDFFEDLLFKSVYVTVKRCPTLNLWLSYLPSEFCMQLSICVEDDFLRLIKRVSVRGYSSFLMATKAKYSQICNLADQENKTVKDIIFILSSKLAKFKPNNV